MRELFELQKKLDEKIIEKHNLDYNDREIVRKKGLALIVELSELANETRCFKYWSIKGPSEKNVILEEFADCLHFILSIGNDLGYNFLILEKLNLHKARMKSELLDIKVMDMIDQISYCFYRINEFLVNSNELEYIKMFVSLLLIADKLEFTNEEVWEAYKSKNEINHLRQEQGY